MKNEWKKQTKKPFFVYAGLTVFVVAAALMIFYRIISNLSGVSAAISAVAKMLLPFIVGLALAYLLSPFYDWIQRLVYPLFAGKKETPRRFAKGASKTVATVAAVLLLLIIVGGLLGMVIPQAYQSISNLITTLPEKSNAVLAWINGIADTFGKGDTLAGWISDGITWVTATLTAWAQNELLPNLGTIAVDLSTKVFGIIGTLTNVFIGVVICIYALNSKELFKAQAKKLIYSLFPVSTGNYIVNMTRYIDQTFGKYLNGMLIDSVVLGLLCFVGMSLFRMPYALLISVIVCLFNLIPIFGPLIAAVIGAFFVLLENPLQALFFLIFILIMQQLDGNVIAPKIIGDQTGLSAFWVIFAIVVFGGLFGVWGMILGVPAFAVIYALIEQFVENRLQKKSLPDDTEAFRDLLEIDEDSGELKYGAPSEAMEIPEYEDNMNKDIDIPITENTEE